MRKNKAFGYLRVSDRSQVNGDGFTRQEKEIMDYALSNNVDIVKVFREDCTGTEYDRPALAELIVSLEENGHGVKTVIVEKLDRLARDYFVQEAIIRDLQKHGFNLISALEGADLLNGDPSRKLVRQMFGVIAEYEKSMLVAKLRASRDRKRARGEKADGRYGYKDTDEGRKIIQLIYDLRHPTEGRRMTYKQIADYLNQSGIRTLDGKQWELSRVYLTLTKKKYPRKKKSK
jgi:DNA invertase Pin-like site-specific DNA recombinase